MEDAVRPVSNKLSRVMDGRTEVTKAVEPSGMAPLSSVPSTSFVLRVSVCCVGRWNLHIRLLSRVSLTYISAPLSTSDCRCSALNSALQPLQAQVSRSTAQDLPSGDVTLRCCSITCCSPWP